MTKKQDSKIQKISKHFYAIAKLLDIPTDEWKRLTINGYIKKEKKENIIAGLIVYVDGLKLKKHKHWWEFWK